MQRIVERQNIFNAAAVERHARAAELGSRVAAKDLAADLAALHAAGMDRAWTVAEIEPRTNIRAAISVAVVHAHPARVAVELMQLPIDGDVVQPDPARIVGAFYDVEYSEAIEQRAVTFMAG